MMQVTDHLQENAALGKASAYLQMIEREPENEVDEQDDETDLVGKTYGLIVWRMEITSLFCMEDHMSKQKFIHFWSTGYWNNSIRLILLFMGVHALISFMNIRGVAFCIVHILIIVAWVHGMTGLWLHLQ